MQYLSIYNHHTDHFLIPQLNRSFFVLFAQGQTVLSITDSMSCFCYPKLLDFMSSLPSMSWASFSPVREARYLFHYGHFLKKQTRLKQTQIPDKQASKHSYIKVVYTEYFLLPLSCYVDYMQIPLWLIQDFCALVFSIGSSAEQNINTCGENNLFLKEATTMRRSPCTTSKSSPCSLQLEKARPHQWRLSAVRNKYKSEYCFKYISRLDLDTGIIQYFATQSIIYRPAALTIAWSLLALQNPLPRFEPIKSQPSF